MAFDSDNNLYISNERGDALQGNILKFKYQNQGQVSWLTDTNDFIEQSLLELINSGDKENIAFSTKYVQDLEIVLGKQILIGKAA